MAAAGSPGLRAFGAYLSNRLAHVNGEGHGKAPEQPAPEEGGHFASLGKQQLQGAVIRHLRLGDGIELSHCDVI